VRGEKETKSRVFLHPYNKEKPEEKEAGEQHRRTVRLSRRVSLLCYTTVLGEVPTLPAEKKMGCQTNGAVHRKKKLRDRER
jgi:hypothetical protein